MVDCPRRNSAIARHAILVIAWIITLIQISIAFADTTLIDVPTSTVLEVIHFEAVDHTRPHVSLLNLPSGKNAPDESIMVRPTLRVWGIPGRASSPSPLVPLSFFDDFAPRHDTAIFLLSQPSSIGFSAPLHLLYCLWLN